MWHMPYGFNEFGFLCSSIGGSVASIRADNEAWFRFAEDTNAALMRVVVTARETPVARGINWSKEAVAVRLLMRSCGSLQGVMLMAKRGMIVQARMLIRAIIEDCFYAGALTTKPDKVIAMMRDGAEASRLAQAKFIVDQQLGDSAEDRKRLEQAMDEMDKQASFLRPRKVAALSPMLPQYLNYMRLSEDSAHTSASSLNKHVDSNADGSGWGYKIGPAQQGEIESTLHRAMLAVLPVGVVVNQFMPDPVNNAALKALGNRLQALPTGTTI